MAETRIDLGKKGILVVSNREYNNSRYVDVRMFFKGKDGVSVFPTKQGLTFYESAVDAVVKGLLEAKAAILANKAQDVPVENTPTNVLEEIDPF